MAGTLALPNGEMPSDSQTVAMVFAVNLTAAGAGARARMASRDRRRSASDIVRRIARADRLEHVLDGDVAVLEASGRDRAAVEDDARGCRAAQAPSTPRGDGLVAADKDDDARRSRLPRGDELDRVRDDLAAHQRGAHAFRAHRDAVGDGDGVELERRAAGVADPSLDVRREIAEVIVAGADLDPGVGDPHQRAIEVVVRQADRAQHRARGRAAGTVDQSAAAPFQRVSRHRSRVSGTSRACP